MNIEFLTQLAHRFGIGKFPSVAALLTEFHNYPVTFFRAS
jgi:hypothetical protein